MTKEDGSTCEDRSQTSTKLRRFPSAKQPLRLPCPRRRRRRQIIGAQCLRRSTGPHAPVIRPSVMLRRGIGLPESCLDRGLSTRPVQLRETFERTAPPSFVARYLDRRSRSTTCDSCAIGWAIGHQSRPIWRPIVVDLATKRTILDLKRLLPLRTRADPASPAGTSEHVRIEGEGTLGPGVTIRTSYAPACRDRPDRRWRR